MMNVFLFFLIKIKDKVIVIIVDKNLIRQVLRKVL